MNINKQVSNIIPRQIGMLLCLRKATMVQSLFCINVFVNDFMPVFSQCAKKL